MGGREKLLVLCVQQSPCCLPQELVARRGHQVLRVTVSPLGPVALLQGIQFAYGESEWLGSPKQLGATGNVGGPQGCPGAPSGWRAPCTHR